MTRDRKRVHGPYFAKIVRWEDERGTHTGIVEGQKSDSLDIFVFDKVLFGSRRTSRRIKDIKFC